MILTRKMLVSGERIPHGYGMAYLDYETGNVIAYPIVFNLIVRWLRNVYHTIAYRHNPMWFDRKLSESRSVWVKHGFKKGYDRGFYEGYVEGFRVGRERERVENGQQRLGT
jgi:hypothetical protein